MADHRFELPPASDGQVPIVHCWDATGPGRGAIILAHGMGEHSLRYARLARLLATEGFKTYAIDHRGHGLTVSREAQLGDYGPDGWRGLVDDAILLISRVREEVGGPTLIMGHSMGSMLVQQLLVEASHLLDGAALSGTTAVDVMAGAVQENADESSGDSSLFASFNAAFEPVRTESDWLSRDPEQVDLYVADPLCGFSVSDASLGSLMISGVAYSTDDATAKIRKDIPIYLFAGDADPVSRGGALVTKVAERYAGAGISDVTVKLYEGARHEVFNETNRAEVEQDFIAWANQVRDAHSVNHPKQ